MGRTSGAAVRIYQITYLVGFFLGCGLYMSINYFFPPPGVGIAEEFDSAAMHAGEGTVIEGVSARTSGEGSEGNGPVEAPKGAAAVVRDVEK
jgi:hypothetical protein